MADAWWRPVDMAGGYGGYGLVDVDMVDMACGYGGYLDAIPRVSGEVFPKMAEKVEFECGGLVEVCRHGGNGGTRVEVQPCGGLWKWWKWWNKGGGSAVTFKRNGPKL